SVDVEEPGVQGAPAAEPRDLFDHEPRGALACRVKGPGADRTVVLQARRAGFILGTAADEHDLAALRLRKGTEERRRASDGFEIVDGVQVARPDVPRQVDTDRRVDGDNRTRQRIGLSKVAFDERETICQA